VFGCWHSAVRADPITQLVVFGDSLSDVGNTFAAKGIPPAPYYQGRYSNGPIWVEVLASRLGVAVPTPSTLGGTDYAFGGAEAGTGASPAGVPNVLAQVGTYLGSYKPGSGQLFVLWAGANNFFNGQTNPLAPVADLGTAISTLSASGARQFLVANYADLGRTPFGLASDPATRQGLTALTQGYNTALAAELTKLQSTLGVHIAQLDTAGLYQKILSNPAAAGFSNVTMGAVADKAFGGSGYLFWDDVHPTAAAHQIIGAAAAEAVAPEPASLALIATGGLGAVLLAWRSRRARTRAAS
jgi:phospholipase/lecithinase/hemolysin